MKKASSDSLLDQYNAEYEEYLRFLASGLTNLKNTSHYERDASLLCEIVFHRSYVAYENMISEYIIMIINNDATKYIGYRENAIIQSIREKYNSWDSSRISFKPTKNIKMEEIRNLIDKNGENITFSNYSDFVSKTSTWLPSAATNKIRKISSSDQELVNCGRLIRNAIAHQSTRAFKEMNEYLLSLRSQGV